MCRLWCQNAVHALLALALVGPHLTFKPPLAVPRRLDLHIDCDVQFSRQFLLVVDALAAMVQRGGAVCSLPESSTYHQSVNKLRRTSVNAQLAMHIMRCPSGVLLGVV
jgi:hypothetical protein